MTYFSVEVVCSTLLGQCVYSIVVIFCQFFSDVTYQDVILESAAFQCLVLYVTFLSGPALGMFEVFGRTGLPILRGRLFGRKKISV